MNALPAPQQKKYFIYFDESGQSGCVLQKDDLLNFQKQPTFAVGAVMVCAGEDTDKLIIKYNAFKDKFDIASEIKGSSLLTKARNNELEYFLKNILDRHHFFVLLYDKRFYISTLLLNSLVGLEYQRILPVHFYQQASILSQQKDDFFVQYLKYIENPSTEAFTKYLHYLVGYEYINFGIEENAVVSMAQKILEAHIEDKCYDDFLTFGWYDNPRLTNLINLNALSEIIFFIKSQVNISNTEIIFVHDRIKEFESTIHNELEEHGIKITFADSKNDVLLQIADNIVSIMRHSYDKGINHLKAKEIWKEQSKWDLTLLSRLLRKLSINHINFTVPVNDWAAALCVATMFDSKYPRKYQNNIHFNHYYQQNLISIYSSLSATFLQADDVIGLLEK